MDQPIKPDYVTAAANTAVNKTYAGAAGKRHCLSKIDWSYNGDPTAGALTVTSGGVTIYSIDITKGGPGPLSFANPIMGEPGEAVVVTLAAGGSGVVGKLNVQHLLG